MVTPIVFPLPPPNARDRQLISTITLQTVILPKWMTGNVQRVIVTLIKRRNEDGLCTDDWNTIAILSNVSLSTVTRTIRKLKNLEAIVVYSMKSPIKMTGIDVQVEFILNTLLFPRRPSPPTDTAHLFVNMYYNLVKSIWLTPKNGHNKYQARVCRNFEQRWSYTFQNWLDDGRTEAQIDMVIRRAFQNPKLNAHRGPHVLKRVFDKLLAEEMANPTPVFQSSEVVPGAKLSKEETMDILNEAGTRAASAVDTTIPISIGEPA
jgi:hypothetical protein